MPLLRLIGDIAILQYLSSSGLDELHFVLIFDVSLIIPCITTVQIKTMTTLHEQFGGYKSQPWVTGTVDDDSPAK